MARRKTITDNAVQKLEIAGDGERIALIQTFKHYFADVSNRRVIILNPREQAELVDFIKQERH